MKSTTKINTFYDCRDDRQKPTDTEKVLVGFFFEKEKT